MDIAYGSELSCRRWIFIHEIYMVYSMKAVSAEVVKYSMKRVVESSTDTPTQSSTTSMYSHVNFHLLPWKAEFTSSVEASTYISTKNKKDAQEWNICDVFLMFLQTCLPFILFLHRPCYLLPLSAPQKGALFIFSRMQAFHIVFRRCLVHCGLTVVEAGAGDLIS